MALCVLDMEHVTGHTHIRAAPKMAQAVCESEGNNMLGPHLPAYLQARPFAERERVWSYSELSPWQNAIVTNETYSM